VREESRSPESIPRCRSRRASRGRHCMNGCQNLVQTTRCGQLTREEFFDAVSQGRPISFSPQARNADRSIDVDWIKQVARSFKKRH
jgi:hypothetical protein